MSDQVLPSGEPAPEEIQELSLLALEGGFWAHNVLKVGEVFEGGSLGS